MSRIRLVEVEALGFEVEGLIEKVGDFHDDLDAGAIASDDLARQVCDNLVEITGKLYQAALDCEYIIKKKHRRQPEQQPQASTEAELRRLLNGMTPEQRERFLHGIRK